jgi:four helix bundle protein
MFCASKCAAPQFQSSQILRKDGNKEFQQFIIISKGSCGEVRAQLRFAYDRNYISEEQFDLLHQKLLELSRQLSGFSKYLRENEKRGRKFN